MLDYNILKEDYSEKYPEAYEDENKICTELNKSDSLLYLAKQINGNIPSDYKTENTDEKKALLERYSGGTLDENTIVGNLLILKILTDEKKFKAVSQEYFNTLKEDYPLNKNTHTQGYDKKTWEMDYAYIKGGIDKSKDSSFIYKDIFGKIDANLRKAILDNYESNNPLEHKDDVTDEEKETFWNSDANKKQKIAICMNAGVTNWLVDHIFSQEPNSLENATTGVSLNIILGQEENKEADWLNKALDEKKLLLSGPSGTAARMMLYFLWFHGELEKGLDEKITDVLKDILKEDIERQKVDITSKDSNGVVILEKYISIIKAILLPPFDHHSIYEINTVLEGLHPQVTL